jgi:hypothetical protein
MTHWLRIGIGRTQADDFPCMSPVACERMNLFHVRWVASQACCAVTVESERREASRNVGHAGDKKSSGKLSLAKQAIAILLLFLDSFAALSLEIAILSLNFLSPIDSSQMI